jgi:hypothetical protein
VRRLSWRQEDRTDEVDPDPIGALDQRAPFGAVPHARITQRADRSQLYEGETRHLLVNQFCEADR